LAIPDYALCFKNLKHEKGAKMPIASFALVKIRNYVKNVFFISLVLFLASCSSVAGEVAFQPYAIPLRVSINTWGEISFDVETELEIPTLLGTVSVGVIIDPLRYFEVDNILTVRLNNEDHYYDLHGEDFEIEFESGYYDEISFSNNNGNPVLVLRKKEQNAKPSQTNSQETSPPVATSKTEFLVLPRSSDYDWDVWSNASSIQVQGGCARFWRDLTYKGGPRDYLEVCNDKQIVGSSPDWNDQIKDIEIVCTLENRVIVTIWEDTNFSGKTWQHSFCQ
jgi:hypothetical protein